MPTITQPPDRLLVGEVRQEEALDLLIALNSGLPGMCSIHANSAREAIVKLCSAVPAGGRYLQPCAPSQQARGPRDHATAILSQPRAEVARLSRTAPPETQPPPSQASTRAASSDA